MASIFDGSSTPAALTFQDIGNMYRVFLFDAKSPTDAGVLAACLEDYSSAEVQTTTDLKRAKLASALKNLASLIRTLNERYPASSSQYESLDHEIRFIQQDVNKIIRDIKAECQENLKQAITNLSKKIQAVVKSHFKDPLEVGNTLRKEATRQQELLKSGKLAGGFIGLYEIAFERPNLQSSVANNGIDRKFLTLFPRPLLTIIRSFFEKRSSTPREQGILQLQSLIKYVNLYKDSMRDLYLENSDTEYFISQVLALKETGEDLAKFYDRLKLSIVSLGEKSATSTSSSGIGLEQLESFIKEKAKEIHAATPAIMRGDNALIAKHVTGGFLNQQRHGQGALLSGDTTRGGDLFGDGIQENINLIIPLNEHSGLSLDTVENQRMQKACKEIGQKNVRNFYDHHQLVSARYTVRGSSLDSEEVTDPLQQASMTVSSLVGYELEEFARAKMLIGGLDIMQREELTPQMAKKVIFFGINHDIFSMKQILFLLTQYPKVLFDDETAQVLEAAEQRIFEKLEIQENKAGETSSPMSGPMSGSMSSPMSGAVSSSVPPSMNENVTKSSSSSSPGPIVGSPLRQTGRLPIALLLHMFRQQFLEKMEHEKKEGEGNNL
jgi:hypothetical protein